MPKVTSTYQCPLFTIADLNESEYRTIRMVLHMISNSINQSYPWEAQSAHRLLEKLPTVEAIAAKAYNAANTYDRGPGC